MPSFIQAWARAVVAVAGHCFSAWSMVHGVSLFLKTSIVDAVTYCGEWPEEFASANIEGQARMLEHLFAIQIQGLKHSLPNVTP